MEDHKLVPPTNRYHLLALPIRQILQRLVPINFGVCYLYLLQGYFSITIIYLDVLRFY